MTRAEAVKKLQRIYGKTFGYRVTDGAPTSHERAIAQEQLPRVREAFTTAGKALHERMETLLAADQEYQTLKANRDALRKEKDTLLNVLMSYKFTAGHTGHGWFTIDAQGDTWEQVFEELKEKFPNGKRGA